MSICLLSHENTLHDRLRTKIAEQFKNLNNSISGGQDEQGKSTP